MAGIGSSSKVFPPVSLAEGLRRTIQYEFVEHHDGDLFYTELKG